MLLIMLNYNRINLKNKMEITFEAIKKATE